MNVSSQAIRHFARPAVKRPMASLSNTSTVDLIASPTDNTPTPAQTQQQTLLKIDLQTGRRHQIRAQLSHIGHPVIGDSKYGATQSMKLR